MCIMYTIHLAAMCEVDIWYIFVWWWVGSEARVVDPSWRANRRFANKRGLKARSGEQSKALRTRGRPQPKRVGCNAYNLSWARICLAIKSWTKWNRLANRWCLGFGKKMGMSVREAGAKKWKKHWIGSERSEEEILLQHSWFPEKVSARISFILL